ncbi:hypothetical protein [Streptomyces sp. UNOC14_S4]|uniref:hypothetical protein n=1 Tax=Streptomyces sp. UNOC14_S4 TaxID=2872340 RepID=UPI001E57343C|nr:hypothetical protein [Streptomyces sp. UNOC14_S4]MCC3766708.1 hypothetical protein [Streptomyces sp. UNOC14_S4]
MLDVTSPEFITKVWRREAAELATCAVAPPVDALPACLDEFLKSARGTSKAPVHAETVTVVDGQRADPLDMSQMFDPGVDTDMDSYIQRIETKMGGRFWNTAYFGLPAVNADFWDFAKAFADLLARALGHRPGGRVDIDCFVGRYEWTHTGAHVDYADNFAFTVRPGKVMLTWPSFVEGVAGAKWPEYEAFRDKAKPLRNLPDRIAYFPYDTYHIAESRDEVSLNMNLAFWNDCRDTGKVVDRVRRALNSKGPERAPVGINGATTLAVEDADNLNTLRRLVTHGDVERWMAESALRRETSSRLGVPRPVHGPVGLAAEVSVLPTAGIQWYVSESQEWMMLGGNGHVAQLAYDRRLLDDLVFLVDGGTVEVRDLPPDAPLGRVLQSLAKWGVVGPHAPAAAG